MNIKIRLWLILACTSVTFAGCMEPSLPADPTDGPAETSPRATTFRFGLGLSISGGPAPWGSFAAPTAEVAAWDTFFRQGFESFREPCASEFQVITNSSEDPPLLVRRVISGLFVACEAELPPQIVIEDLRRSVKAELSTNRDQFNALSSFSNVSSVEVVATLMQQQIDDELAEDHTERLYRDYLGADEGSGDLYGQAQNLVRYYQGLLGRARVMHNVLTRLPDQIPTCSNDVAGLAKEVHEAFDRLNSQYAADPAMSLAGLGRLGDGLDSFVMASYPRVQLASARDWWPLLYASAGLVPYYETYFAQVEFGTLPSYHEAVYLQGTARNASRSIYNDYLVHEFADLSPAMAQVWERHPHNALAAMALTRLEWRFEDLSCFVSASEAH